MSDVSGYVVEPLALGWYCPNADCGVFNGDEKVFLLKCRTCETGRPKGMLIGDLIIAERAIVVAYLRKAASFWRGESKRLHRNPNAAAQAIVLDCCATDIERGTHITDMAGT